MGEPFRRRAQSQLGEGEALKEEILRAAARMLAESGREGELSLRAVAREVGIAAPSVYLHFRNRAELVDTLTRRAYGRLAAELREARAQCGEPRAAVHAVARRYCRFALDNPRVYRLMFGIERIEVPRDEVTAHPLWQVRAVWDEAVSAYRPAHAAGPERERRVDLLWFSLHGMVAMAVALPFAVDRAALRDRAADLVDLVLAE
ncbi:TetR/AcrR family transcriptional regulator [Streptomyces sp. NPDC006552]|uniref:TetR/AcrR family transcriptional regulator n=1 Tax=Streptomyces sp. NPDC006552 TaxID=3157179 RepID=UPI0033AA5D6E